MTNPPKTIGVEDVALLLHRSPATVRADVNRRPETLPPRIVIPGSKKLVWLYEDVMAWLEECRKTTTHKVAK